MWTQRFLVEQSEPVVRRFVLQAVHSKTRKPKGVFFFRRSQASPNDLSANSNSNFEFATKRVVGPNDQTFRLKLCWRWGAACSMPRVSDIDYACGILAHHMFLSNCVMQVMRVWSLAAVLSLLAKHDTPRRGNASWFRADPRGLDPDHAFR
jgi:hypothetical protein